MNPTEGWEFWLVPVEDPELPHETAWPYNPNNDLPKRLRDRTLADVWIQFDEDRKVLDIKVRKVTTG